MRIISGFLKGKKINFLKNSITRPLKDSVKENIFNILNHSNLLNIQIEKSLILDLYSGVGSFGIECISRGAKKVTFVEKDNDAIKILKKNLNHLSIIDRSCLINKTIDEVLKNDFKEKFHVFFLDPPFKSMEFVDNLKKIRQKKLFNKNHVVIIHRAKKTSDNLNDIIKTIVSKEYGRSKIIFGFFD